MFNKTQNAVLDKVKQGPFNFDAEWILYPDGSLAYCVRGHQMYHGATGLQNVGLVKVSEQLRRSGRKFAEKYSVSGPTEIITYRVES